MEREYPWFLDTYDTFPENIMRSDAVRLAAFPQCLRPWSSSMRTALAVAIAGPNACRLRPLHHYACPDCMMRCHAGPADGWERSMSSTYAGVCISMRTETVSTRVSATDLPSILAT